MTAANPIPVSVLRQLLTYDPVSGAIRSRATDRPVITNVHHSGYLKGAVQGRTVTAHRVAIALHTGHWPNGEVDHINGICDDNRLENLRIVTKSENQKNARRRLDNTSGAAGVYKRKNGRWSAYVSSNGSRRYLGCFNCLTAALVARLRAASHLGFTPRHGL